MFPHIRDIYWSCYSSMTLSDVDIISIEKISVYFYRRAIIKRWLLFMIFFLRISCIIRAT